MSWRGVSLAAIATVVACQAIATPSSRSPSARPATPSGPPILGVDWGRAAALERPENFLQSVPPDYISNHPILRIAGQASMTDVAAVRGGPLVAVGFAPPDWLPVAWSSTDGRTWSIHSMGLTTGTFPVAVTAGPDGTFVAVGRSGKQPVAWTSRDGVAWRRRDVPVLGGEGVAERMTSVVAANRGYLAGGSSGPELGDRHARFWTSADGATWLPVADDPTAFAGAEVRAIAPFDDGFAAVGVVGTAQTPESAVAWLSDDGARWSRVDSPTFDGAVAVSVTAAPSGGLVAVGSSLDRQEAVVWSSREGRRWERVGGGQGFQEPGFVWMTDVAAVDGVLIAVGDYQPNQRGTAVSWVTRDGRTWDRGAAAPVQEQAEFAAIAAGGPGAVAVGTYGLPDSYVPTVWLTPAH